MTDSPRGCVDTCLKEPNPKCPETVDGQRNCDKVVIRTRTTLGLIRLLQRTNKMSGQIAADGRPITPKDTATTPTKGKASQGLIQAFGTLRIDNQDGASISPPSIMQLMGREASETDDEEVQVTDPIREKANATKKYLRKKYAERRRNGELANQRRKTFEVCW